MEMKGLGESISHWFGLCSLNTYDCCQCFGLFIQVGIVSILKEHTDLPAGEIWLLSGKLQGEVSLKRAN